MSSLEDDDWERWGCRGDASGGGEGSQTMDRREMWKGWEGMRSLRDGQNSPLELWEASTEKERAAGREGFIAVALVVTLRPKRRGTARTSEGKPRI